MDTKSHPALRDPRTLAKALGGDPIFGSMPGANVPAPGHGPHNRALRIYIKPETPLGFRVKVWGNEPKQAGEDHVCDKLGIPRWGAGGRHTSPSSVAHPTAHRDDETADQQAKLIGIWTDGQPNSPRVLTYLREARGLDLGNELPGTIRGLPPSRKYPPTMVAPFGFPHEGAPGRLTMPHTRIAGLHFTRLTPDGSGRMEGPKAKTMLGRYSGSCSGHPIVVAPMGDNLGLAITEGIEDALSVHLATGLGAWAAGSATFMPALAEAVPDYTEVVTIVADANDAGQHNARRLADRLVTRGIATTISTPGAPA